MKKTFLLLFFSMLFIQSFSQSCYEDWKKVFDQRGAYTVNDDMHRKVIISFFEGGQSYCAYGKVRVENGRVVSIFVQFEDGTFELMDQKFSTRDKKAPTITNGISDEIINDSGEVFRILFIEKIKPKAKSYKSAGGPGDEFK